MHLSWVGAVDLSSDASKYIASHSGARSRLQAPCRYLRRYPVSCHRPKDREQACSGSNRGLSELVCKLMTTAVLMLPTSYDRDISLARCLPKCPGIYYTDSPMPTSSNCGLPSWHESLGTCRSSPCRVVGCRLGPTCSNLIKSQLLLNFLHTHLLTTSRTVSPASVSGRCLYGICTRRCASGCSF